MKERDLGTPQPPSDRNIRLIAAMERQALEERSIADRLSDVVTRLTGNGFFASANVAFFALWIIVNTGVGALEPFDPFPFNFLTLVVSLEAIFLSIFVLMSQNRMTRTADKRAHLDLQVDLLAEQELTTMLQMLHALCAKFDVKVKLTDDQMRALLSETDVHALASAIDDRLPSK